MATSLPREGAGAHAGRPRNALEGPGLPLQPSETRCRPWWEDRCCAPVHSAVKGTLPRVTTAAPLTRGNLERAGARESLAQILFSAYLVN